MYHRYEGSYLFRKLVIKEFVFHHNTCGPLIVVKSSEWVSSSPKEFGCNLGLLQIHKNMSVDSCKLYSKRLLLHCIGFAQPGFGSRGGYRSVFCKKLLEVYSMSSRANVQGSSKMDTPLAKAEPIRNGSNTSEITYLRK